MKIKLILIFLTLPIFSACQTLTDYSVIGISKQNLDKKDTYTLNNKVDYEKNVDSSVDAIKVKKEISGEYLVQKQWNRYLNWDVEKVNIDIKNGSLVADLYAKGKSQPFYGIQANDCTAINFVPNYDDPVLAKRVQSLIKFSIIISDGLLTDMKVCGSFIQYQGVIEYKSVKKGYKASVYEHSPIDVLSKWGQFIVPEDGYIITLRDKKISGGWQDQGSAEITIYAKKTSEK